VGMAADQNPTPADAIRNMGYYSEGTSIYNYLSCEHVED